MIVIKVGLNKVNSVSCVVVPLHNTPPFLRVQDPEIGKGLNTLKYQVSSHKFVAECKRVELDT